MGSSLRCLGHAATLWGVCPSIWDRHVVVLCAGLPAGTEDVPPPPPPQACTTHAIGGLGKGSGTERSFGDRISGVRQQIVDNKLLELPGVEATLIDRALVEVPATVLFSLSPPSGRPPATALFSLSPPRSLARSLATDSLTDWPR